MNEKFLDIILSKKVYGPVIIIICAILFYNIIISLLKKASIKGKTELEKKRRKTIILLINNILKYIFSIVSLLMILNIYGVDTSSIVTGLGVVGLVVGLAFQDALKDIIGGINIIMDNYFVVGDVIKYKDFTGTVISFGLKTTQVKSDSGDVLIVTNRNLDAIINMSQKQTVITFDIPTSYDSDQKIVEKTIKKIIEEVVSYDYVDDKESKYLGIDKITGSTVTYLFQIKCAQGKETELKREVLLKIKESYEKNKLKIAS